jgi:putative ABC transport system permease protein
MLGSYLNLAWKVLGRRKFFTFVSLFGVGFTLMVLVVALALLDQLLGVLPPEVHQDRMVSVHHLRMSGPGNSSGANVGRLFVTRYLSDLPGVERLSFFTNVGGLTSRLKSTSYSLKNTDGEYWKILQFDFLEGAPYTEDDVRDRRFVAVMTRGAADRYFGPGPALGKTFELDAQRYRIVGVVRDVSPLRELGYADVWAPLSTIKGDFGRPELLGGGTAMLLMHSASLIPHAREVLRDRLAHFESPDPHRFKRLEAPFDTAFQKQARDLFGGELVGLDNGDYSAQLWLALILVGACFLLLPTVNLVNINISRILERASEIGVRKSFGATSRTLVGQFLVENLVLTLVGAGLGVLLALATLGVLSNSAVLPGTELHFNPRVAAFTAALALVFGIVSGVYPAWRMSRLHPVQALRGGER